MISVRSPRGARGQSWLGQLERAFNQSGAIVGEVYALAARGILSRIEGLEDRAIERRFRHRKQPPPARPSPEEAARPTSSSSKQHSTPESSA